MQPLPNFRGNIYQEVVTFIEQAREVIPDVQASIVTHQKDVDEKACEQISENTLGVKFRARRFNLVG